MEAALETATQITDFGVPLGQTLVGTMSVAKESGDTATQLATRIRVRI